jgi:hypothetical protein
MYLVEYRADANENYTAERYHSRKVAMDTAASLYRSAFAHVYVNGVAFRDAIDPARENWKMILLLLPLLFFIGAALVIRFLEGGAPAQVDRFFH